jgi:uncharacterized protein (DUF305 family)
MIRQLLGTTATLVLLILAAGIAAAVSAQENQFLGEMRASMVSMHKAMEAAPTGDTDADFVVMMTAHHQGAIDMARIQLHYGHNEQLRRIAQEIIVEQQQEILAMRRAVGASP